MGLRPQSTDPIYQYIGNIYSHIWPKIWPNIWPYMAKYLAICGHILAINVLLRAALYFFFAGLDPKMTPWGVKKNSFDLSPVSSHRHAVAAIRKSLTS